MRSAVCREGSFTVADSSPPAPAAGQLLLDVQRCGICGSDLHASRHGDDLAEVMTEIGYDDFARVGQDIVFGHELCGVVAGRGRSTKGPLTEGTPVVSIPLVRRGGEVHALGLTAKAPGAYAEQVLVEAALTLPVPNGLPPEVAVLTEPLAVGWHAVQRGEVGKGQVAIVIGCGPVGLSIIALLKARGVRTVIASDLSPGRRRLATACGADVVVDPTVESPYASAADHGHVTAVPDLVELAIGSLEKLGKLPVPWWHVWRALEKVGATTPKAPVVFECVGAPGVIDQILAGAPLYSRVVVVGVCMGADRLRPSMAVNKEIDLRFVVGYTPLEFRDALRMLAEGKIDASPLVTGTVGLSGVENAFAALGDPELHAKILIDPKSTAESPAA